MYSRCNLCGKIADWLVLFYDEKERKTYATTRCHECVNKPEPQLNNKEAYNRIPLWYGSWAFPEVRDDSPFRLPRVEVLARLSPDVILLPNPFEETVILLPNPFEETD